jgi:hypothetical protein
MDVLTLQPEAHVNIRQIDTDCLVVQNHHKKTARNGGFFVSSVTLDIRQSVTRLSKYSNFEYILISRLMDSRRFKNKLEFIEKRC